MQTSTEHDTPSTLNTGRVKWFNNKAGYGFITVVSDKPDGDDVFVHHSAIQTRTDQYNYLVQGEYVWFNKDTVANKDHDYQASNVTGVYGGLLMCETKSLNNKEGDKPQSDEGWNVVKKTRGKKVQR
jgi:cold shock CspA family protein